MGVHPWPGIDPASAYMTMTGGAWAAPMHAAGAALDALGAQVEMTVAASAVNASATAANWTGSGAAASAASGAELGADQSVYSMLSLLKSEILHSAGELHTTTVPQMVTHIQADANRGEWGIDNAINPWVLGMLTPRLIDLDTEYFGFMWPNNASAGLRYGAGLDALGAALSGLSALPSLAGGSVAAPAMAAADVASNAGMSMMSAVMSATEQAATSAISPATSGASQAGSPVSQSQLSAPNPSSSTSGISPMAAVQSRGPVSPSLAQSQPPALGMFAPPAAAAALTPSAPSPAMPASPPVQAMTPSAVPGVTSFAKPAEPFNPPPPSGGKAVGLKPGMLNASALRGPVGTTPASTALLTKPLTTASSLATQPLAYVSPTVPPSQPSLPSQPNLEPGAIQTLQPPPTPPQTPPPPAQMPPAVPQNSAPATSSGPTGTGSQGTGAQMLGSGPPGAPQAPPVSPSIPLAPGPELPIPPIWPEMTAQEAQAAYDALRPLLDQQRAHWKPVMEAPAAAHYNARTAELNAAKAELEAILRARGVTILEPGEAPPPGPGGQSPPDLPSTPTGQSGTPMNVPKVNADEVIDGTRFSGHALDEMQSDGIPLSVVQNALRNGIAEPGKLGRTILYDPANNISVIRDVDGSIVTVTYGHSRG